MSYCCNGLLGFTSNQIQIVPMLLNECFRFVIHFCIFVLSYNPMLRPINKTQARWYGVVHTHIDNESDRYVPM